MRLSLFVQYSWYDRRGLVLLRPIGDAGVLIDLEL